MRRVVCALILALGCGDDGGGGCGSPQILSCDDQDPCTADVVTGHDTCGSVTCAHHPIPAGAMDQCCPAGATQRTDPDCAPRCGDGVIDPGEQCDDRNTAPYDGCSATCQVEEALILSAWSFEGPGLGCDLDGDGVVDNAFGTAPNDAARSLMTSFSNNDLHRNPVVLVNLIVLTDLSDLAGRMDGPFRLGMLLGEDADMTTSNNFDQTEAFPIDPRSLAMGDPLLGWLMPSISSSVLAVTTDRMMLPLTISAVSANQPNFVEIHRMSLVNVTVMTDQTAMGERIGGLSGRLCGAVLIHSMEQFRNSTGTGGPTYLDDIALGVNYLNYQMMPTQPDQDLDGDGKEVLMDTDGDMQIDLCIDGNGTQILGTTCVSDPRIADGYSMSVQIQAVRARIAGLGP
jgi:cysteine-rich repeat protein